MMRRSWLLAAAAFALAGCSSVTPDKPTRATAYDFGPPGAEAQAADPAPKQPPLVLADLETSSALDSSALLYRLAAHARAQGYTTFVALTMGTNQRMLDVLRYAGFPHTTSYLEGEVAARLDITVPVTEPLAHTA